MDVPRKPRFEKHTLQWDMRPQGYRVLALKPNQSAPLWLTGPALWHVQEHWVAEFKRTRPCVTGCSHCPRIPVAASAYVAAVVQATVPDLAKGGATTELVPVVARFREEHLPQIDGLTVQGLLVYFGRGSGNVTLIDPWPEAKFPGQLPPPLNWQKVLMRFWGVPTWPVFAHEQAEESGSPDVLKFKRQA